MLWEDRHEAGQQLAAKLRDYAHRPDTVLLGLPRGGVVTASVVANTLQLPLDILIVKKIGAPHNEELAIGAIDETGQGIFFEHLIQLLNVSPEYLTATIEKEKEEAHRRLITYRGQKPALQLEEKTAILIDDGIATGATMLVAIASCRAKGAAHVVVATPVIAPDTTEAIRQQTDALVYLSAPTSFGAVGSFYRHFEPTTDEEVIRILHEHSPM